MYIKEKNPGSMWTVCTNCGSPIKMKNGGSCKCGNVKISKPDKNEVQIIEVEDQDKVVYDND